MFWTFPLYIIKSFSLYTQQWYMSYCLRAGSVLILLASCQQICMSYTIAVCTVKNCWWWTEELSETCGVLFQNKFEKLEQLVGFIIPLKPNDPYMGRTAPLTSKCSILYIYSTNIGTEYFKHALYSPLFSLQNAVCFIMLTCLFLYYSHFIYRVCCNLKKIIPAPKDYKNTRKIEFPTYTAYVDGTERMFRNDGTKFWRWGNTQKLEHNILKRGKFWSQEMYGLVLQAQTCLYFWL